MATKTKRNEWRHELEILDGGRVPVKMLKSMAGPKGAFAEGLVYGFDEVDALIMVEEGLGELVRVPEEFLRAAEDQRLQPGPGQVVVKMLKGAASPVRVLTAGTRYILSQEQAQLLVAVGAAESEGLTVPKSVYDSLRPPTLTQVRKMLDQARRDLEATEVTVNDLAKAVAQMAGRLESLRASQSAAVETDDLDSLLEIETTAVQATAQIVAGERILRQLTEKRDRESARLAELRNTVDRLENEEKGREYLRLELEASAQLEAFVPMLEELMDAWMWASRSASSELNAVLTRNNIEPLLHAIEANGRRRAQLEELLK